MRLRLRPLTPLALRGVVRRLRRIEARRDPALDLAKVRAQVRRLVAELTPGYDPEAVQAEIESYIDTFIYDFLRPLERRHHSCLGQLDHLEAKVQAYLEEAGALNLDVYSQLTHLDGAVTHALDRVSDPDTPFNDHIPQQRPRKERP